MAAVKKSAAPEHTYERGPCFKKRATHWNRGCSLEQATHWNRAEMVRQMVAVLRNVCCIRACR